MRRERAPGLVGVLRARVVEHAAVRPLRLVGEIAGRQVQRAPRRTADGRDRTPTATSWRPPAIPGAIDDTLTWLRRREQVALGHERLRLEQQLAVAPVMHVDPAGLAGLRDRGNPRAVLRHLEQHRRARDVVAPAVVRHLLVVPHHLAGPEIERDERRGVQVVARARGVGHLGRRVAGAEDEQLALGVHHGRGVDGAAAVLPGLGVRGRVPLFPGDVALERDAVGRRGPELTLPSRSRYVEVPDRAAGSGVERGHESGAAILARDADDGESLVRMQPVAHPRDADEHLAVVDQRRRADAHAGRAGGADARQRIALGELARRLGGSGVLGHGHVPRGLSRSFGRARSDGRRWSRRRPCHPPPRHRDWPVRSRVSSVRGSCR